MYSNKKIHLSIDDVWCTFDQLFKKHPHSIFNIPFFRMLQILNEKYGARFTLYIVGKHNFFNLMNCSGDYVREFSENASWLKFALHCTELSDDYEKAMRDYKQMYRCLLKVVGLQCISMIVRLHGFNCENSLVKSLSGIGIKTLLCADDERISYSMTNAEDSILRSEECFEKNGLLYIPTKIRLEKNIIRPKNIDWNTKCSFVSAFTHEYFFYGFRKPYGYIILKRFLCQCKREGVEFYA